VASVQVVDFTLIDDRSAPIATRPVRSSNGKAKTMSPKQLRARARRRRRSAEQAMEVLYKPVAEWDEEELSRGRPRDKNGQFRGSPPGWVTREVHEEAMTRFRSIVKDRMASHTIKAVDFIGRMIDDNSVDEDGKPVVPFSTRLDGSKFLVEHVLGKPKQRVEQDISVRLQGMLAASVVVPGQLPATPSGDRPGHFDDPAYHASLEEGILDAEVVDDEDDEDDA
jgi:hypothetical protein